MNSHFNRPSLRPQAPRPPINPFATATPFARYIGRPSFGMPTGSVNRMPYANMFPLSRPQVAIPVPPIQETQRGIPDSHVEQQSKQREMAAGGSKQVESSKNSAAMSQSNIDWFQNANALAAQAQAQAQAQMPRQPLPPAQVLVQGNGMPLGFGGGNGLGGNDMSMMALMPSNGVPQHYLGMRNFSLNGQEHAPDPSHRFPAPQQQHVYTTPQPRFQLSLPTYGQLNAHQMQQMQQQQQLQNLQMFQQQAHEPVAYQGNGHPSNGLLAGNVVSTPLIPVTAVPTSLAPQPNGNSIDVGAIRARELALTAPALSTASSSLGMPQATFTFDSSDAVSGPVLQPVENGTTLHTYSFPRLQQNAPTGSLSTGQPRISTANVEHNPDRQSTSTALRPPPPPLPTDPSTAASSKIPTSSFSTGATLLPNPFLCMPYQSTLWLQESRGRSVQSEPEEDKKRASLLLMYEQVVMTTACEALTLLSSILIHLLYNTYKFGKISVAVDTHAATRMPRLNEPTMEPDVFVEQLKSHAHKAMFLYRWLLTMHEEAVMYLQSSAHFFASRRTRHSRTYSVVLNECLASVKERYEAGVVPLFDPYVLKQQVDYRLGFDVAINNALAAEERRALTSAITSALGSPLNVMNRALMQTQPQSQPASELQSSPSETQSVVPSQPAPPKSMPEGINASIGVDLASYWVKPKKAADVTQVYTAVELCPSRKVVNEVVESVHKMPPKPRASRSTAGRSRLSTKRTASAGLRNEVFIPPTVMPESLGYGTAPQPSAHANQEMQSPQTATVPTEAVNASTTSQPQETSGTAQPSLPLLQETVCPPAQNTSSFGSTLGAPQPSQLVMPQSSQYLFPIFNGDQTRAFKFLQMLESLRKLSPNFNDNYFWHMFYEANTPDGVKWLQKYSLTPYENPNCYPQNDTQASIAPNELSATGDNSDSSTTQNYQIVLNNPFSEPGHEFGNSQHNDVTSLPTELLYIDTSQDFMPPMNTYSTLFGNGVGRDIVHISTTKNRASAVAQSESFIDETSMPQLSPMQFLGNEGADLEQKVMQPKAPRPAKAGPKSRMLAAAAARLQEAGPMTERRTSSRLAAAAANAKIPQVLSNDDTVESEPTTAKPPPPPQKFLKVGENTLSLTDDGVPKLVISENNDNDKQPDEEMFDLQPPTNPLSALGRRLRLAPSIDIPQSSDGSPHKKPNTNTTTSSHLQNSPPWLVPQVPIQPRPGPTENTSAKSPKLQPMPLLLSPKPDSDVQVNSDSDSDESIEYGRTPQRNFSARPRTPLALEATAISPLPSNSKTSEVPVVSEQPSSSVVDSPSTKVTSSAMLKMPIITKAEAPTLPLEELMFPTELELQLPSISGSTATSTAAVTTNALREQQELMMPSDFSTEFGSDDDADKNEKYNVEKNNKCKEAGEQSQNRRKHSRKLNPQHKSEKTRDAKHVKTERVAKKDRRRRSGTDTFQKTSRKRPKSKKEPGVIIIDRDYMDILRDGPQQPLLVRKNKPKSNSRSKPKSALDQTKRKPKKDTSAAQMRVNCYRKRIRSASPLRMLKLRELPPSMYEPPCKISKLSESNEDSEELEVTTTSELAFEFELESRTASAASSQELEETHENEPSTSYSAFEREASQDSDRSTGNMYVHVHSPSPIFFDFVPPLEFEHLTLPIRDFMFTLNPSSLEDFKKTKAKNTLSSSPLPPEVPQLEAIPEPVPPMPPRTEPNWPTLNVRRLSNTHANERVASPELAEPIRRISTRTWKPHHWQPGRRSEEDSAEKESPTDKNAKS